MNNNNLMEGRTVKMSDIEKFYKITSGFVTQTFEKKNNMLVCTEQIFTAGDSNYEEILGGESIDVPDSIYEAFTMVTPTGNVSMFVVCDISCGAEIQSLEAGDLIEAQEIILHGFNVTVKEDK